ncbi:MAG TPA: YbdK family carboxylate-amine ligase [Nocardioides sp.]|nr:YbdK family carboxylate-amine ligase [Nocardioides sp.]
MTALSEERPSPTPAAATVLPPFGPGGEFTVGAEEELLLVDERGHLVGDAGAGVVSTVASSCVGAGAVTGEIFTDQVELGTDVCSDAAGVGDGLRSFRRALADCGSLAMAAGVPPTSPFGETRRVQSPRYDAISAEFAGLFRTPTSAFQVHVGMPDADTAITVYRGLRNRLALFRALGAASPFWHGRDSGLASARSAILRSYPRCTMPPILRSYEEYEWRMRQVIAAAEAPDYTYVWWDLRPHPRLGTLELRVMDARASVDQCVALTALAQGMARHAAEEPTSVDLPVEVLQENDFRAYRYGLDARVLDIDGYVKPLRQLAQEAVEDARDALRGDGLDEPLDLVAAMLHEPLECETQRRVHAAGGMAALLADLVEQTMTVGS